MGGPSKTLLRPSDAQERKKTKKVTKITPKICPETVKKGSKNGTRNRPATLNQNQKKQPLSLFFFGGWGSFGRPSTALPPSLTNSLASTSFVPLFVLGHLQREKPRTKIKETLQTTMLPALCFDLPSLWPLGFPFGLSS